MFAFAHRFSYANCFGRLQVPIWKNRNERKHKCWTQTQFYYSRRASVKLTPQDVNLILNAKEFNKEFSDSVVKSYDSNQVASNNPLEDRRSEATCLYTNGSLFGVFDGHAGPSCAQIICKRLMRYIAASLLPPDVLKAKLAAGAQSHSFLQCHNDKVDFVPEVNEIYEKSFAKYARGLCYENIEDFQISFALQNAFLHLDDDIGNEALTYPNALTLSVAMSGAVACIVHIDGIHLHVANTGDCSAVLGSLGDSGEWEMKRLTQEHNSDNVAEVRRITGNHPFSERDTVIRGERLLGQLAPLRAFGDFRYKWPLETLKNIVVPQYGIQSIPQHYYTPPYLTAEPEISYHVIQPKDRFVVIATDGIWDFMTPTQVVKLIGEHMIGKVFLQPLALPKRDVTLGEVAQMLSHRRAGLEKKPQDKNGATHLIRHALGGTEYGIEHSKLSHMLSLPPDLCRLFRDDMTVTIIYFNQEYIRNSLSKQ